MKNNIDKYLSELESSIHGIDFEHERHFLLGVWRQEHAFVLLLVSKQHTHATVFNLLDGNHNGTVFFVSADPMRMCCKQTNERKE